MGHALPDRRLPAEAEMDRADALDAFVAVVNTVEPDHPLGDVWPITPEQVDYGVTRRNYARCGPRSSADGTRVSYSTRLTYINEISRERHLALIVHEITHIPINNRRGNQHGVHTPEFWREMAFHALLLRDALEDGALEPVFGDVDVAGFLHECASDPNAATVDRRYWSVEECRAEMRDLLGIDG